MIGIEGGLMLTVDMVRAGAHRHRDRVAIRYGGAALTFRQVDEAASRMANVLLAAGGASADTGRRMFCTHARPWPSVRWSVRRTSAGWRRWWRS